MKDLYKINKNHDYNPLKDLWHLVKKIIWIKKDGKITGKATLSGSLGIKGDLTAQKIPHLENDKDKIEFLLKEIKALESRLKEYTRKQLNKEKEARQNEIQKIHKQFGKLKDKINTIESSQRERSISEFKIEFTGFIVLTIGILLSTWSESISNWSIVEHLSQLVN